MPNVHAKLSDWLQSVVTRDLTRMIGFKGSAGRAPTPSFELLDLTISFDQKELQLLLFHDKRGEGGV